MFLLGCSEKSARRRYKIFKQHYDTLLRLRAFFPFHLIDGMGTLAECREQVMRLGIPACLTCLAPCSLWRKDMGWQVCYMIPRGTLQVLQPGRVVFLWNFDPLSAD